ncbi:MAG: FAD-linked oxidase C-terminal domain-containing protein [Hyphomicrobiaceae bacterium]
MGSIERPAPDPAILNERARIVRDLEKLIGKASVISDDDGCRSFETDALTAYATRPLAAVLPASTEEVSAVLAYCHAKGVKVVPRGAGTSLAGGALPVEDGIVLGLGRMSRVLDIDYGNRVARVEAGITNLAISEAVGASGFFYAPDPSSQLACTIAGNIAMNSGGAHCLKYGVTTNNVLGVRIVLIDGTIADIGGAHLDAPGYDLLGLIVGSEGQFGVVTEATVRILRKPEGARPMLVGFRSSEDAGAAVSRIIAQGIVPVAIEFMDKPAIEVCESFARAGYPLDVEAMLIIEVEGSEAEIDETLGKIRQLVAPLNPTTVKLSQSAAESAAIWKGRKSAFGAIGRVADYLCMDGTIPLSKLPETLTAIARISAKYGFRAANIFHAGDGNLHPLILYDANQPGAVEQVELCGAEILKHCVAVGGCLTGEHGVGIEKRDLMKIQFSAVDLAQQTRIKRLFDPDWLLNPGKVFPLDSLEAA